MVKIFMEQCDNIEDVVDGFEGYYDWGIVFLKIYGEVIFRV